MTVFTYDVAQAEICIDLSEILKIQINIVIKQIYFGFEFY